MWVIVLLLSLCSFMGYSYTWWNFKKLSFHASIILWGLSLVTDFIAFTLSAYTGVPLGVVFAMAMAMVVMAVALTLLMALGKSTNSYRVLLGTIMVWVISHFLGFLF